MKQEHDFITVGELYDACCDGCNQWCPENWRCGDDRRNPAGTCIIKREHKDSDVLDLLSYESWRFDDPEPDNLEH